MTSLNSLNNVLNFERDLQFSIEIMDFDCESDNTDDIYEVERILEAKKKVS